jgi:hypothetical protein
MSSRNPCGCLSWGNNSLQITPTGGRKAIYETVRASSLYDSELGMYKVGRYVIKRLSHVVFACVMQFARLKTNMSIQICDDLSTATPRLGVWHTKPVIMWFLSETHTHTHTHNTHTSHQSGVLLHLQAICAIASAIGCNVELRIEVVSFHYLQYACAGMQDASRPSPVAGWRTSRYGRTCPTSI